jgi:hypothetical protein
MYRTGRNYVKVREIRARTVLAQNIDTTGEGKEKGPITVHDEQPKAWIRIPLQ